MVKEEEGFKANVPTKIRKRAHIVPREENGIDLSAVSPFAISVCQKLQDAGYKAFIVGGAVRDLLIGVKPKDFDVATDATPEEVKKVTRRAIIIGRRFRLVHVNKGAETIEVATFRGFAKQGVTKDEDGVITNDNVFGEQYEDAARRDFTVNAMYFDPISGDLYDYHHGLDDIRERKIRMIGDPATRYREDPVRILRAIRIAAKLGFTIDEKTAAPMHYMQTLLLSVPSARLADEFSKMVLSGSAVACMELMNRYDISIPIPLFDVLKRTFGLPFVRKGLERCDARVALGKSISTSFLFAVLLWHEMKEEVAKSTGKTPGQIYEEAAKKVADSYRWDGLQSRYVSDMAIIWKLQPRFLVRSRRAAMKLLQHPRFRAAYDFLLLRASSGDASHELADWWTAYEGATDEERLEMSKEAEHQDRKERERLRQERAAEGKSEEGEADGEEKEKKKRRRRRKKRFDRSKPSKSEKASSDKEKVSN